MGSYISPDTNLKPAAVAVVADENGSLAGFLKSDEISRFLEIEFMDEEQASRMVSDGGICAAVIEKGGELLAIRAHGGDIILTSHRNSDIFAVYFIPRRVIVLDRRQPVCVLFLAGYKISSQIYSLFLWEISITSKLVLTVTDSFGKFMLMQSVSINNADKLDDTCEKEICFSRSGITGFPSAYATVFLERINGSLHKHPLLVKSLPFIAQGACREF